MKVKLRRLKMAMLTFVFLLSIVAALPMAASAANVGDSFTENTGEGVAVTYKIVSLAQGAQPGSVQIGTGIMWNSAISQFTAGIVTIPDIVSDGTDNYQVTTVSYQAFFDVPAVQKIILPDHIKTINSEAFLDCDALEEVKLPNDLEIIKKDAFSGCAALKKADLPVALKTIEDNAFSGCASLEKVVIPDSITTLGDSIFASCDSLEEVTFPDHLTSIPNGTFADCSSLTDVKLPEKLATVGNSAFYGCASLLEISFNENLTSIGNFAFEDCTSLADVYLINDNLASIGSDTFANTNSPLNIHIIATANTAVDPKWNALDLDPTIILVRDVFTLTFDLLGGNLDSGVTEHLILGGKTFDLADAPTTSKAKHSFEDWYDDAALTNLVAFPFTVSADTTLYARWDLSLPPTVSKNLIKMTTSNSDDSLEVSLGVGRAAALSATITSDDTALMTVSPATLIADGKITVTPKYKAGTANIIITWVGGPSNGQTVTIPVQMRKPGNSGGIQINAIYVNKVEVSYQTTDDVTILKTNSSIMEKIELNGDEQKIHVFDASEIQAINEIRLPVPASWFDSDGDKILLTHDKIGSIYIEDSMFKGQKEKLSTDDVIFIIRKSSIEIRITHGTRPFDWQSFNKPLQISMPFAGDEYAVMYEGNDSNKIIPRSIYKDDNHIWAKVYTPGIYNAKINTPDSFVDTAGKWMDIPVKFTTSRGITHGIGSGKFAPENSITRADFTAMLVRALGVDTSKTELNKFKDNAAIPSYAREAVNFASEMGIVQGGDTGYFNPNETISRQDMFIITYRAMEKFAMMPENITGNEIEFSDWNQVKSYAKDGIKVLSQLGIVKGADGKLSPEDPSSRAVTAQLLSQVLKLDMA